MPENSRVSIIRDIEREGFADQVMSRVDNGSLVLEFSRVNTDDVFAISEVALVLELDGDHDGVS